MDSYYIKRMEENIDQMTYPAKLSTAVKRMLASRYIDLQQEHNKERDALARATANVSQRRVVLEKELTQGQRKALAKARKLHAAWNKAVEALKAAGVEESGGFSPTLYVRSTDEEFRAAKEAATARQQEAIERHAKEIGELAEVARGLAKAQIDQLKAKLEKAAPAVVKALDAIGQRKALPEVSVKAVTPRYQRPKIRKGGWAERFLNQAAAIAEAERPDTVRNHVDAAKHLLEIKEKLMLTANKGKDKQAVADYIDVAVADLRSETV